MKIEALLMLVATAVLALGAMGFVNAGTNDYSSGFGYWGDPGEGTSIGYEAIATDQASNLATGQFDYREASRDGEGEGVHGEVFCLRVEDDRAWFQITTEDGDVWEAEAVDDGDGNSDTFGLDKQAQPDPEDCDSDDADEEQRSIRGDIVVEEGGFAGGR